MSATSTATNLIAQAATITRPVDEPGTAQQRPRIYDFAEGWGSIYGRYVRNRLCRKLIALYNIRTVLEAPCNAESYFASPGTQSVVFAEEGCQVTLAHPDSEIVCKTRDFWGRLGLGDVPVVQPENMYELPFKSASFDLVWNFDSIPLFDDPARFLAEMERVSAHMVMIILPNPQNIGYPLHQLLVKRSGEESVWGSRRWMDMALVRRTLLNLDMTVVGRGLVDMPPWPGFDVLSALGKALRRKTVEAHEDNRTDAEIEKTLHKLTFIEYARIPNAIKVPFAHQRYILARKRGA